MYVYREGAIAAAIHAKIEASKQAVKGNKNVETASFRDTLRAYITTQNDNRKPVSAVSAKNSGEAASPNGAALIYAMQNSNTDTTAAAVLNALGYKQSGSAQSSIRTAAENLKASAATLKTVMESGTAETKAVALSEFITKYNELSTRLNASGTTSGYLYRTALSSYATEEALKGSGITTSDKGSLIISGEEPNTEKLSPLITGAMTVAQNVSAYASSISGGSDSESISGDASALSGYYNALINLM